MAEIVAAHFQGEHRPLDGIRDELIESFLKRRVAGDLATDQLLNAIYLISRRPGPGPDEKDRLVQALLRHLSQV